MAKKNYPNLIPTTEYHYFEVRHDTLVSQAKEKIIFLARIRI
jgi:hypothetical protein